MRNPTTELRVVTCQWDHTILPATRHKRTHPHFNSTSKDGTRFSYPGKMEGWVDLVTW